MQSQLEEKFSRAELIRQARDSFNRQPEHGGGQKRAVITKENTESVYGYKIKSFVIRMVICLIMFLAVLTVDQMSLSYNEWKSSSIQELIETNQTVNSIKKGADDFTSEKIIPLFHRLW